MELIAVLWKSINFASMKRSLNILMALLLSLMVVYMSVGTTVMHCLSYNKVMVGVVKDCCLKRCVDHDCCQGHRQGTQLKKHCMDVKQVKLSPTQSFQKMDFKAAPAFAGIRLGTWALVPRPAVCHVQETEGWSTYVPHSPPREYLSLLHTLII